MPLDFDEFREINKAFVPPRFSRRRALLPELVLTGSNISLLKAYLSIFAVTENLTIYNEYQVMK